MVVGGLRAAFRYVDVPGLGLDWGWAGLGSAGAGWAEADGPGRVGAAWTGRDGSPWLGLAGLDERGWAPQPMGQN